MSDFRPLSDLDLELLSSYLDGVLSDSERRALEVRLTNEGDLRAELDELRQTVALIKSLPRANAPRNYTLTPEMVGLRLLPKRRVLPFTMTAAFSALSAAAAVVLLVVGFAISGLDPTPTSDNNVAMLAQQSAASTESVETASRLALEAVMTATITLESAEEAPPVPLPNVEQADDFNDGTIVQPELFAASTLTQDISGFSMPFDNVPTASARAAEEIPDAPNSDQGSADAETMLEFAGTPTWTFDPSAFSMMAPVGTLPLAPTMMMTVLPEMLATNVGEGSAMMQDMVEDQAAQGAGGGGADPSSGGLNESDVAPPSIAQAELTDETATKTATLTATASLTPSATSSTTPSATPTIAPSPTPPLELQDEGAPSNPTSLLLIGIGVALLLIAGVTTWLRSRSNRT